MTKGEQIGLLKRDVLAWNALRKECPIDFEVDDIYNEGFIGSDLTGADLRGGDLSEANLEFANLTAAQLRGAKLSDANLTFSFLDAADLRQADLLRADLSEANAEKADFRGADLRAADLKMAHLTRAKLHRAKLSSTDLSSADLRHADLRDVDLSEANLSHADLTGADVTRAVFGVTLLAAIDLSQVIGLSTAQHSAPSSVGIDTIVVSKGNINPAFLRGAGVPGPFIANMHALIGAVQPIQFYSCFISYSGKDRAFAERVYADLQVQGVRCWKAPEDFKTGDTFRARIDEEIRRREKLLVVLSANSVESEWVAKEVETAFEEERRRKKTVLFPIRLDDAVMDTNQAWAADIRPTRHIGDFRRWKRHDCYRKAFSRLLSDLKTDAGPPRRPNKRSTTPRMSS